MTFEETIDKIFQGYDVRGYYPEQYNGDTAYRLGRAAVAYTGAKRVMIGRDMRHGGHAILSALAMGAMDQGADVTDGGMCSSDALYYAGFKAKYDLSLMVTASHNPAAYNGTKLVRFNGTSIGTGSGLAEVKAMVLKNKFPKPRRRGALDRTGKVMPQFVSHALSFISRKKLKPLKIVVDAGNGMGGELIKLLGPRVPFKFIPMFFEPDGDFPNHEADPTRPECVKILQRRVRKEKADLGLGFDGDADRSALIDEKGGLINGSELGSVIAKKFLKKERGAGISYCLVSSWTIRDTIIECGGMPLITPVGGANIRPMMMKHSIMLATERSGHFYMRDNNLADSGLIAALISLEQLCEAGCSLSELIKPYKRYYMSPELSLMLGTDDSTIGELSKLKKQKVNAVKKLAKGARVIHCNEDRFEFDNWWFCVRPSGTEPRKLRMTVEATSKKLLKEKYDLIAKTLTD
jgi:phosphomannomutase